MLSETDIGQQSLGAYKMCSGLTLNLAAAAEARIARRITRQNKPPPVTRITSMVLGKQAVLSVHDHLGFVA